MCCRSSTAGAGSFGLSGQWHAPKIGSTAMPRATAPAPSPAAARDRPRHAQRRCPAAGPRRGFVGVVQEREQRWNPNPLCIAAQRGPSQCMSRPASRPDRSLCARWRGRDPASPATRYRSTCRARPRPVLRHSSSTTQLSQCGRVDHIEHPPRRRRRSDRSVQRLLGAV